MRFLISLSLSASLLIMLSMAEIVSADPPKKPNVSQYSRLWTNSPFTIKPVKTSVRVSSPMENEWTLGSISPSGKGYSVTLINKKDRKNRLRFLPGIPTEKYQLLDVKQDVKNHKNSKVQIKKGSQTAWITYDESLIKLKTPTAKGKTSTSSTRRTPIRSTGQPTPGKAEATSKNSQIRVRRARSVGK